MKNCKSKKIVILSLLCILFVTGCGNGNTAQKDDKPGKKAEELRIEQKEEAKEEENAKAVKDDAQEGQDAKENVEEKTVKIYASNDMADGFVTEEVKTDSLTADWLVNQLASKGVVPEDVKAVSCQETETDGVKALNLDLNSAFSTFVGSMGTAGEYYTVGSLCNTFLDAYGCEKIKITVEGAALSTGHTEYSGYLVKFE